MPVESYNQHYGALLDELEWLDQLLHQAVDRVRATQAEKPDPFQGTYVPEAEIDSILLGSYPIQPAFCPSAAEEPLRAGELAPGARSSPVSATHICSPRLHILAERFGLSSFEVAALLIALAPELDLKYERLYGYLHDDITRRRPTVDLALNLLCPTHEAKLVARRHFAAEAPLLRNQLQRLSADPADHEPVLLRQSLIVEERVVRYLLGDDGLDPRLLPYARLMKKALDFEDLLLPAELKRQLLLLAGEHETSGEGPLLYFQGPYGVGKRTAAGALSDRLGMGLLVVDGERLLAAEGAAFERMVGLVLREAALQAAALYWGGFDALLSNERCAERDLLVSKLAARRGPSFLSSEAPWEPSDTLAGLPFVRLELPSPDYQERAQLWGRALNGSAAAVAPEAVQRLAGAFRLSGGQIRDAAATAHSLALRRHAAQPELTADDLAAACRLHSNRRLAELAQKITPHYSWDDIVLPEDRMRQLREICNSVRYRPVVYGEWGFERRLALGRGLNVLFAGPSGTGKTMAAEIIAGELGLELYKIDLATVVSKYIGETEKNLARIFAEAETSNAILFFDEADALFGKRSEVKDAHDRYANVEIAYLLQRMEEYEGITILATNLRKNVDEAFVRRLQFIVEFPFPGEADRRRIWEVIWPDKRLLDPELDLDGLARRFDLSGGNIRNIALAAAFLAAADGKMVRMGHVLHAVRREHQKIGKVLS